VGERVKKGENNIYIVDSTLRDGEQAPGVAFSRRDKLRLAEMLADAGVDELEAGIPAMGEEERSCIRDIINLDLPCRISCWCRAKREDIESAAELKAQGVHISFPVSSIILRAIGKDETWVLKKLEELVPAAGSLFPQVSVGALDATRADSSFLRKFTEHASSCGAYRLRIADTVGIASPVQVIDMFRMLTVASKTMILEFHGHNDLGMATANAVCAVIAGTGALSVTVNGLGERAGNTPLEEIALALPVSTGKSCHVQPDKLQNLCSFVSRISNREIPVNKPVTGSRIFTHESGIHCHALIKDTLSYQPYPPAMVGRKTEFVIGKHSGSTIIRHVLQHLR
jgi:homocitrate synthase NifV